MEIERTRFAPTTPMQAVDQPEAFRYTENTDQVPLILGLSFGFDYVITDLPPGAKLDFITEHPPIDVPGTGLVTSFTIHQPASESFGYGFDEPFELVEGAWRFALVHEGVVLCEQRFESYSVDQD